MARKVQEFLDSGRQISFRVWEIYRIKSSKSRDSVGTEIVLLE